MDWTVQAFDCYNWDPGKGIGIGELSDKNMCCIENAGKGSHFRVRSDVWENKFAESKKDAEVDIAGSSSKPDSGPGSSGSGSSEKDRRESSADQIGTPGIAVA